MNGARARTDYSPRWKPGPLRQARLPSRRCKGVEACASDLRAAHCGGRSALSRLCVILGALVARSSSAQQRNDRRNADARLADLQSRSRRHPLLAADADQHEQRLDTRAGVVVSTASRAGHVRPRDRQAGELVRNLSAGHAHRRERRDVSAIGQSRGRARARRPARRSGATSCPKDSPRSAASPTGPATPRLRSPRAHLLHEPAES